MLQVDDAHLPMMYDNIVNPGTPDDFRRWARLRIDALNHALEGIPTDRSRYHICWGSFNSPHVGDVPFEEIADLVLSVNVGGYAIEMANPRHEHEWRVWEDLDAARRQGADPRRDRPHHQRRRAPRAGRRAPRAPGRARRARAGDRRHRLRLRAGAVRAPRPPQRSCGPSSTRSSRARLATDQLW